MGKAPKPKPLYDVIEFAYITTETGKKVKAKVQTHAYAMAYPLARWKASQTKPAQDKNFVMPVKQATA